MCVWGGGGGGVSVCVLWVDGQIKTCSVEERELVECLDSC